MRKALLFLIMCVCSLAAGAQDFEKARLEIICQALKFSHDYQGLTEVADQLNCSSFEALLNSLPKSSKASRTMIANFRTKNYTQFSGPQEQLKQLNHDISQWLQKINRSVNRRDVGAKQRWTEGIDSLEVALNDLGRYILEERTAQQNTSSPTTDQQDPTTTNPQNISIVDNKGSSATTDPTASSNTGLWIITILSILIAFVSLGYAYLTNKTVMHRIQEAEIMFKERYNKLDTRMDKMLTREEFENSKIKL